jgi:hypothetical protein
MTTNSIFHLNTCGYSLSFTIGAGPRQRGHSHVRVQLESLPYFTVSDSRRPQPGRPGPRIYIPQERSEPVPDLEQRVVLFM